MELFWSIANIHTRRLLAGADVAETVSEMLLDLVVNAELVDLDPPTRPNPALVEVAVPLLLIAYCVSPLNHNHPPDVCVSIKPARLESP